MQNDLRWLLRRGSPLPIPNREVKPDCADGTAICGRVCRRLSFKNPYHLTGKGFLLYIIFSKKLSKADRTEKLTIKSKSFEISFFL